LLHSAVRLHLIKLSVIPIVGGRYASTSDYMSPCLTDCLTLLVSIGLCLCLSVRPSHIPCRSLSTDMCKYVSK